MKEKQNVVLKCPAATVWLSLRMIAVEIEEAGRIAITMKCSLK